MKRTGINNPEKFDLTRGPRIGTWAVTRQIGRCTASLVIFLITAVEVQAFDAPQINGLSDETLARSGRLLIFGTNFGGPRGEVLIDGLSAIATTWTDTEIHAYVPEAATLGSVPVQVTTARGSSNAVTLNVTMRQSGGATSGGDDRVRWRFQMDSDFAGRFITVAPDGTVYASDLSRLYALSPDGALLWVASAAGGRRPISIGVDGTIYTAGNLVKAINPDGTVRWQFANPHPGADLTAGPNVGPDGNIYAVHNTWFGGIGTFSLDADGNLRWADTLHSSSQGEAQSNAEIVFGPDRAFVATAPSGNTYVTKAVDFDGDELWHGGTGDLNLNAWYRPKLDPSGRVISSKWSLSIQAITSDGDVDWVSLNPHGNSMVMPGIDPSTGVIYTSSWGPSLWAINPNGSTRWTTSDSDEFNRVTGLNVPPDGSMILTNGELGFGGPGWLLAYDTTDGAFLWRIDLPAEAGGEQFVWSVQPTFTLDSQTAYVTTEILGSPGFSYVYALRIGDEVEPTPGDLDGDGDVDAADLAILLGNWGPCGDCGDCPADLGGDCMVGAPDLAMLLGNWG
ncbi:MAG: PQQ-binding-like beta-propeller repeat protein [Planctomycetes bacterium]|nr:PQQ-binding-like beta-propeller repeat protein [Planctomycetota bacterium]